MLQFVGQHPQIIIGTDAQDIAIDVNYFPLVASRVHADRMLVGGAEVTRDAPNVPVDYVQMGVIVHPGGPFLAEVGRHPGVNHSLKGGGGPFQSRLLHPLPVFHVPVGVGSHQP